MFVWFRNRSIFIKLSLTIIIAVMGVSITIVSFILHLTNQPKHKFNQFIEGAIEYIIEDLGNPPNMNQARRIGVRLGVEIRYEGPLEQWSTSEKIPSSEDIIFHHGHSSKQIRFGHEKERFFLLYSKGEDLFVLMYDFPFHNIATAKWILGLALPILIIFIITYLFLRRIFSPIKSLSQGVQKVSEGDYDMILPVVGKDELSDLVTAFNQMTDKIKKNIHSKEQLLLDVSHELRSPLTRVKVALEMMEPSIGKKSIQEDMIEMETMITELLETARLQNQYGTLALESSELGSFLSEFIANSDFQSFRFQTKIPNTPIWVQIDRERIKIVLKNLLENALKYSEKSDAPVLLSLKCKDQHALIEIRDQGVGISEEELPFLFEPFYRVDPSRSKKTGGYGLGLSLCQTIIRSHSGEIKIDSKLGYGTTITIELPTSQRDR